MSNYMLPIFIISALGENLTPKREASKPDPNVVKSDEVAGKRAKPRNKRRIAKRTLQATAKAKNTNMPCHKKVTLKPKKLRRLNREIQICHD